MEEIDLKIKMRRKLEEIVEILYDSSDKFENPGVLAGISGLALFMYYYARYTGESKYDEIGEHALEKAVDMINNGFNTHTYCSGISGLAWTFEHLAMHKFIERNSFSPIVDLEPYLLSCMEKDFKMNNYDFLHGGLGVGYYFLTKRVPNKKQNQLTYQWLKDTAISCKDNSIKWKSLLLDTGEPVFNISLSHGMSSIVVVLTKLMKQYPHITLVKNMLLKTITYILQQQLQNPTISYFPSYSLESNENALFSRLGWCYGDLGIAQAILQASKALRNKSIENVSMKILMDNCFRKDLNENRVFDAGLCHGASGISHIFRRLYIQTKIDEFDKISVYWMEKTIEMAHFIDGLAGYKSWYGEKDGWTNQYSLLEGIIGVGLCMLSQLNPVLINWDECLLLN